MNKTFKIGLVLLMLLVLSSLAFATDFTTDNQGWWTLKSSLVDGVIDQSINLYDLTNSGTSFYSTDDVFEFDGSTSHLETSSIVTSSTGTISLWINPADLLGNQVLFNFNEDSDDSNNYFSFMLDGDKLRAYNPGDHATVTDSILSTGSYQHIVLTSDGTRYKFYLDGSEQTIASGDDTGFWSDDVTSINHISIGSLSRGSQLYDPFEGYITGVSYYDTELTSTEVAELYAEGRDFNPYAVSLYPISITDSTISPTTIYFNDDADATVTVNDTTDVKINYDWLVNDVSISTGTVSTPSGLVYTIPTLDKSNYDYTDVITLTTYAQSITDDSQLSETSTVTKTVSGIVVNFAGFITDPIYTTDDVETWAYITDTNLVYAGYELKVNSVTKASGTVALTGVNNYDIPPLASSLTIQGDSITLEVTPKDSIGTIQGETVISSASTVVNRNPTVTSITSFPTSPTEFEDFGLYCEVADADLDTLSIAWEVFKNSVSFDSGTIGSVATGTNQLIKTVALADTVVGDEFYATCTVTDPYAGTSGLQTGSTVTIQEARVTLSSVVWNPSTVYTLDDTESNFGITSINVAGDYIELKVYKNSVLFDTYTDLIISFTDYVLSSADTTQGDQFYYTVVAKDVSDNTISNTLTSTTLTISNHLPTASSLEFNPNPPLNDASLSFHVTPADGDLDTLDVEWEVFKNTVSYSTGTSTGLTSGVETTLTTISGLEIVTGDTYSFTVRVYDGIGYSSYYNSDLVSVVASPYFTISATDLWNDAGIDTFSANIDGTIYTSTTGSIVTDILRADSNSYDITISATDYVDKLYSNYDTTLNLDAELYQSIATLTAETIYLGQTVENFTVETVQGNFSTTNGTIVLYPNLGNYSWSIYSEPYYTSKNNAIVIDSSSESVVISNLIDTVVLFQDFVTGLPLSSESVTVSTNSYSDVALTTDASGYVYFSGEKANGSTSFNITLEGVSGYITPITYEVSVNDSDLPQNITYDIYYTNFNINIYDRITGEIFTSEANVVIEGVSNSTTSTGNYNITDVTISPDSYSVTVSAFGYSTEQQTIIYTSQSNLSLNFYLLNETSADATTVTIQVTDDVDRLISGATVILKEYDVDSQGYIQVSEGVTESNGQTSFLIEIDNKKYKITASKEINGELYTAEFSDVGQIFKTNYVNGEEVIYEEEVLTLKLRFIGERPLSDFLYLVTDITETFDNTTNVSRIGVDFYTKDGTTRTVCVEYFIMNNTIKQSITGSQYCTVSSNGEVTPPEEIGFKLNLSYVNIADVYVLDGTTKTIIKSFVYQSEFSLATLLKDSAILKPIMLLLWIGLIAFSFLTGNIPMFGVLGTVLSWIELYLFPTYAVASGTVLKTLICLTLIYFGRKKEDFE